MNLLSKAKQFAINAHDSIGQKRKYTGEPYHVHCERVAALLQEVTQDEEVLAAAWLHDVLEDVAPVNSDYSEEKMRALLGKRVSDLVLELTDYKGPEKRALRKEKDRLRLQGASNAAKTIKLADCIDNYNCIKKYDRHFFVVFSREVKLLLPCLKGGDARLFAKLSELLK